MQPSIPTPKTIRPLDRIFAIAGTLICLVVTTVLWVTISANQSMWPLPGLYFLEMAALSVVCARLAFMEVYPRRQLIIWAALGIFIGFSILGAWSVGFFYLPVAILFGVVAVLFDVRNKQPIALHFGVCLIAGALQVVVMLELIHLLF